MRLPKDGTEWMFAAFFTVIAALMVFLVAIVVRSIFWPPVSINIPVSDWYCVRTELIAKTQECIVYARRY